MDRILIKPISKEIILRGKPEDGHSDVFSYNYEGETTNGLGSLFIVGHVQPATEDTSYMINLVASLAKREYYTQNGIPPKEAFSKSLKKINEVLREFFKNKDTRINIGILAIAGENILISRLGKFKVILARDNQDIDILNNINLFSKEHIQEKEFSNIISGKIMPKDKIFAFYPAKPVIAREKNIKASLLGLGGEEFSQRIQTIRQDSENFYCAGIHITIDKHKEPAVIKSPQPKELKKELAQAVKPSSKIKLASADISDNQTAVSDSPDIKKNFPETINIKMEANKERDSRDSEATDKPAEKTQENRQDSTAAVPQTPLIIPSEFSSAKKENLFEKIASKLKIFRKSVFSARIRTSTPQMNFKRFSVFVLPVLILLIAGGWLVKGLVFLSPEEKELKRLVKQAEGSLKLAEEKITSNDLASARNLLLSSLLTYSLPEINDDFALLLDKIDNAVSANLSALDKLPDELSARTTMLFSEKQKIESGKYELPSAALGFDVYQDNLYILTNDKIFKVIDAVKGSTKAVSWLAENTLLVVEPELIAIDGNTYVLNKSGVVTKYFKGEEVKRLNTSVGSKDNLFFTARDLPNLYLVNKKLGRIYLVDKESGSITKVLKIGNSKPLSNAYVDSAGILYIISGDNKIWRVE